MGGRIPTQKCGLYTSKVRKYVLVPLGNMVAYAQAELRLYDPLLVSQNRYWVHRD